jgi:putative DNA primase/helicase
MEFLSKLKSNNLVSEKQFEAYRQRTEGMLNLRNGVLDTRTLTLHKPDPQRGFKYGIDYDYVPGATCPRFDSFLSIIMRGNPDLIQAVWDAFAACLWNGYQGLDASFWVFSGSGSNGKTSLLSIIVAALGGISNCVYLKPKHFKSDERFALSSLEGKLLCVIEEVNEGHLGDDFLGMVKDMTDGGTIAVEGKQVNHWQMRNTAKVFMTTNKSLVLQDTTEGLKRRLILAPCEENFEDPKWAGKKDPDIVAKILPELPGILNKGLEALQKLRAKGGKPHHPALSNSEMEHMVMNSDSVERWAREHIVVTNCVDDFISSREAYAAYKEWLGDDSAKTTVTTFSTRIRKKTYAEVRARNPERRAAGTKMTVIWGVKKAEDSDAKF